MSPTEHEKQSMLEPGQQLRRVRERLQLKYRDVEEASARIAQSHGDEQFQVGLSRLADIENRGTVPSIFRIYSLCAIYRLGFKTVLGWYGVDLDALGLDTAQVQLDTTTLLSNSDNLPAQGSIKAPLLRDGFDVQKTLYLTKQIVHWGRLPVSMLEGLDVEHQRYAFIGVNDWFMYPLLRPGSFVQVDESRKKVLSAGWLNEWERPIYLLEHRGGYRCAWCSLAGDILVAQPHPASQLAPEMYRFPEHVDVVGQLTGIAMRLHPAMRHHTRSSTGQE